MAAATELVPRSGADVGREVLAREGGAGDEVDRADEVAAKGWWPSIAATATPLALEQYSTGHAPSG